MTDPDQTHGRSTGRLLALVALPVLCCLGHLALLAIGAGSAGALLSASLGQPEVAAVLALAVLAPITVLAARHHTKGERR